jgi:hypothetical protein
MKKLNWKIIESTIIEAKEELENIEKQIQSSKKLNIAKSQISLQHVYHHLNFAWNTKHKKIKEMTDKEF